eukprot:scaffold2700_cov388-Prasinococcus_capsulatus_cf.AAC.4
MICFPLQIDSCALLCVCTNKADTAESAVSCPTVHSCRFASPCGADGCSARCCRQCLPCGAGGRDRSQEFAGEGTAGSHTPSYRTGHQYALRHRSGPALSRPYWSHWSLSPTWTWDRCRPHHAPVLQGYPLVWMTLCPMSVSLIASGSPAPAHAPIPWAKTQCRGEIVLSRGEPSRHLVAVAGRKVHRRESHRSAPRAHLDEGPLGVPQVQRVLGRHQLLCVTPGFVELGPVAVKPSLGYAAVHVAAGRPLLHKSSQKQRFEALHL